MDSKWLKKMAYTIDSNHDLFHPYRKKHYLKIPKVFEIRDPLKSMDIDKNIEDIKVRHDPNKK